MTQPPGEPSPPDYLSGGYVPPQVIVDLAAARRRRRRVWIPLFVAFDVLVVLVVVGVIVLRTGAASGSASSASRAPVVQGVPASPGEREEASDEYGGERLVPSNPRALAAAVVDHLPPATSMLWCTGTGSVDWNGPGPDSAAAGALIASMVVTANGHQYYLSVIVSANDHTGQQATTVVPKHDQAGRVTGETVFASSATTTTVILELSGPGGAGRLPLGEAALRRLVADPRIGPRTTPQLVEKGERLPRFTTSPPAIDWPHSPI